MAVTTAALGGDSRSGSVPTLLRTVCRITELRYATVLQDDGGRWVMRAVYDDERGLLTADGVPIDAELCDHVRATRRPLAIDDCEHDALSAGRSSPRRYGFRSFLAVPVDRNDGAFFGCLCAFDPAPAAVSGDKLVSSMELFAQLVALEFGSQIRSSLTTEELLSERAVGLQRERFIAMLGHDLRTPLNAVLSGAHVLKLRAPDPVLAGMAERVIANARRMASMVTDLVDLARGEQAGGMRVSSVAIDGLAEAIESVVDELRASHPDRQIFSSVHVDRPVAGDKGRLQQLVANLVGNALTHGSSLAPVRVAASTASGELEVSVHNEGHPIPSESMPGLFDPYTRKAPAGAGPGDGLGLGLYICRQIVQAHGGTLTVSSSEVDGTWFTARIPLAGPAPGAGS